MYLEAHMPGTTPSKGSPADRRLKGNRKPGQAKPGPKPGSTKKK